MVSMMITLRTTIASSSSSSSSNSARATRTTLLLPLIVACTSIILASTRTAVLVDGFVPIPQQQRTTTQATTIRTYNSNNGSVRINVNGQQRLLPRRHSARSSTTTMQMQQGQRLTNIEMPLLDLSPEFYQQMIQPLPSSHLQSDELTTLNIYGMEITRPSHKMVVNDAIERNAENTQQFGHIAYKPNPDNLIGAIGCAAEIIVRADSGGSDGSEGQREGEGDGTETTNTVVLCRGTFRFVVRDVIKTIPFPVAIVDELVDDADDVGETTTSTTTTAEEEDIDDEEEEEEDHDDDDYDDMPPSELVQRTLSAMKQYAEMKLEDARAKANEEISPLEQSIIEDMKPTDDGSGESSSTLELGVGDDRQAQLHAAEETYAVYDVFQSSLGDLAFSKTDQYYAVAFMACEMASMSNDIRRQCLQTTNGIHRVRLVLKHLDELIGMTQARKLADTITTKTDESQKDLQVGQPALPPWSKRIVKGTKIEYYWNEEYGWSSGQVIEDPLTVVDEIILTVQFDSDMSIYKLPFTAEDKVRWRPVS